MRARWFENTVLTVSNLDRRSYKLASDGQDTRAIQQYLGDRNITHTARFTALSLERFKTFWKD